eukprot:m.180275 g.180275  ORF g.180275 m.180275 type:complete len:511 (+) comp9990_c2_seq28:82-1614(+)
MSRTFQSACIQLHFAVSNMASALDEAKRMEAENSVALKELREEIKQIKTDIDELLALKKTRALDDEERQLLEEKKKEKERLDGKETALTKLCEADTNRVTQLEAQQGADLLALREENARLREREAQQGAERMVDIVTISVFWRKPETGTESEPGSPASTSPTQSPRQSPRPKRARNIKVEIPVCRVDVSPVSAFHEAREVILAGLHAFATKNIDFFDANKKAIDSDASWRAFLCQPMLKLYAIPSSLQGFSHWTLPQLKDVHITKNPLCTNDQYDWFNADFDTELKLPLSAREERLFQQLCIDIRRHIIAFGFPSEGNETKKRVFVNSVLEHVQFCFQRDLLMIETERHLEGSLGRGPVDYVFVRHVLGLAVTEAKSNDVNKAIAQAIIQLTALGEDSSVQHGQFDRRVSYAIVTTGDIWRFIKLVKTGRAEAQYLVTPIYHLTCDDCFEPGNPVFETTARKLFCRIVTLLRFLLNSCRGIEFPQSAQGTNVFPCACCFLTEGCRCDLNE